MAKEKTEFEPMLAGKPKAISDVRFPVLASPKLDGIRAIVRDGVLLSRKLKPIPNAFTQDRFNSLPEGSDGELILGEPTTDPYRRTTSAVMSRDGEPADIRYYMFDNYLAHGGFQQRYVSLLSDLETAREDVHIVPHSHVRTLDELLVYETWALEQGYEGAMARSLDGPYKFGRSTVKEGYLLKIKRFEDSEAEIIGYEERMHNANEATKDAFGRTERSSHQANKVGLGDLGALSLRDVHTGVEFNLGTGLKAADRVALWAERDTLAGKIIKYKFFPTGSKDKPRFSVFKGFRDRIDM